MTPTPEIDDAMVRKLRAWIGELTKCWPSNDACREWLELNLTPPPEEEEIQAAMTTPKPVVTDADEPGRNPDTWPTERLLRSVLAELRRISGAKSDATEPPKATMAEQGEPYRPLRRSSDPPENYAWCRLCPDVPGCCDGGRRGRRADDPVIDPRGCDRRKGK